MKNIFNDLRVLVLFIFSGIHADMTAKTVYEVLSSRIHMDVEFLRNGMSDMKAHIDTTDAALNDFIEEIQAETKIDGSMVNTQKQVDKMLVEDYQKHVSVVRKSLASEKHYLRSQMNAFQTAVENRLTIIEHECGLIKQQVTNLLTRGVNGGWTDWSDWTTCVCGSKSRMRSCTNPPPSGGGDDCAGSNSESSSCPLSTKTCPHSCADVYKTNTASSSWTYTIYNRENQPYEVYCVFYKGFGYTYVSAQTTVTVNVADLFTTSSSVVLRHRRTDSSQHEATIEQISRYSYLPLSVQYNSFTGYTQFINKHMTPYLYLGLLPVAGINHRGDTQGYKVNGRDQTFRNCDANPNSYFAFLFNENDKPPTAYNAANPFMRKWVDLAKPAEVIIPDSYFSFMEMHMGGCGGFSTTNRISNVNGVALGMRFDIA